MRRRANPSVLVQHAPHNAMEDPDEIARFHDRCSDLMRELLDALAAAPDRPRTFPEIALVPYDGAALLTSALADVEATDDAYFVTLEQGREAFLAALAALVSHNP